jgi:hypothetical protein
MKAITDGTYAKRETDISSGSHSVDFHPLLPMRLITVKQRWSFSCRADLKRKKVQPRDLYMERLQLASPTPTASTPLVPV